MGIRVGLLISVVFVSPAGAASPGCESGLAAVEDGPQVLTLSEAASLLRLDETALAAAAKRGEVPGRHLLGAWRFSHAALIAWLAGADRPAECFGPGPAADDIAGSDEPRAPEPARGMGAQEAAAATGAGADRPEGRRIAQRDVSPEAERSTSVEPEPDVEPGEFGEAPEAEEARDVALREQAILLRAGELTLEPSLSYARADSLTGKSETFSAGLTARYALLDNWQVSLGLPFRHQEREQLVVGAGGLSSIESSDDDAFGDLSIGAAYALLGEALWRPSVFLFADTRIPTDGSDAYGLGAGLSLTKTYDPAVLFAGLSYLHTFDAESRGLDRPAHDNTITANLGFAFRVNDLLAYRTSIIGTFNPRSDFGAGSLPSDESYDLELALTWALAQNLFIEPSVSFQLNGPGDAVAFGLSVPYTFGP